MHKYLTIINVFWQRSLTYRFTVFAYRIGEVIEILALIVLWGAIFQTSEQIRGFTYREMVTYLIIGNLFHGIVRNFLSDVIARNIKDGQLSLFLVQPISYFSYIVTKEIGRISVAMFFSAISQIIVAALFFKVMIYNADIRYLLLITVMLFLAFFTELLISYFVGLIAFWTDEIDGLYSTIERIKKFFSGGYFPLSLLPAGIATLSFYLPFAYSFYIPAQLYLKKFDLITGLLGIGVQLVWIAVLSLIIHLVWKKGLKRYEGVGI